MYEKFKQRRLSGVGWVSPRDAQEAELFYRELIGAVSHRGFSESAEANDPAPTASPLNTIFEFRATNKLLSDPFSYRVSIGDEAVRILTKLVDLGIRNRPVGRRDAYVDAILWNEPSTIRSSYTTCPISCSYSSCALVVRSLWRLLGVRDPLIDPPYVVTKTRNAFTALRSLAQNTPGAYVQVNTRADFDTANVSQGDAIFIDRPPHVFTVVGRNGDVIHSIDGGQTAEGDGNCCSIQRCTRTLDANKAKFGDRPIIGVVKIDKLRFTMPVIDIVRPRPTTTVATAESEAFEAFGRFGDAELFYRDLVGAIGNLGAIKGMIGRNWIGRSTNFFNDRSGALHVSEEIPIEGILPDEAESDVRSWPTLTSLPDDIVEQIAINRDRIQIRSEIKHTGSKKGYWAGGNNRIRPTAICTPEEERNARLKDLIERLYVEVGGEGAANAVMTGDSAGFTWGRGLAHKPEGGYLELWVNEFFTSCPQAKEALLDLGITLEGTTWKVMDTASKSVRVGEQAIAVITGPEPAETKKLLLSIFMDIAERFGTQAANAQWKVTKQKFFYGAVPRSIIDDAVAWSAKAVCYVIHCAMWGTFAGWDRFRKTGGDLKKILRLEVDYTRYYEGLGTYIIVPPRLGEREIFPSITMLRNMGDRCMITDRIVDPLDALASAQKGDVVFQMDSRSTPELYVLRSVPVLYDEIEDVQAYSMSALLAHFGKIRDKGGKNKGYRRLKAMRDYYASDRNPRKESFGLRPRVAMDAVLHRGEGEASRWILGDCRRADLPDDQVRLIKKEVGLS